MIQKLRTKFILTNMALVSLVLLLVFAVLVGSNHRQMVQRSEQALNKALLWSNDGPSRFEIGGGHSDPFEQLGPMGPGEPEPPVSPDSQETMVPVFVVRLDAGGNVTQVTGGGNVEVSDEVAAQAAAQTGEEEHGTVENPDLRYLRRTNPDGTACIAFADKSWESDSLWRLVRTSLLVGALALVGFFLISLLLSTFSLKPVKRAWEQQQRFVADASHELKTPLTVILTNTGILLSHPEETVNSQRKWVEYIREETQRMRTLVEDLLFLARGDAAGRSTPPPAPQNWSEICWSALLPFEAVAFESGVTLDSTIEPDLSVLGEGEQLRRLVTILLDNAVKYAGQGGCMEIALARGEKNTARLTVHNTGEPIPPEHLEHLFDRFYRADRSRARTSGGYGLGLAIAKSIAENHNGTIAVTSTAAHGTAFTVTLPLHQ